MLSAPFRSESRAKIKDAFIRGKDYLMMKVQDYQQKIRSNMNTKLETVHPNSSISDHYHSQQEFSDIRNCTMLHTEKHDSNSKSMQDNTEWPSENLPKIPSQCTPQSSELYEPKVKDTAAPCKKVPHNTPHDVPHGVDDLPLGVEANTLNEIPVSKLNEMSPSKPNETTASTVNETPVNNLNKMTLNSTSDENESKPLENSTDVAGEKPASKDSTQLVINPQDKTQQWLHTVTGRQHSFGSDLSAGTNSSSIDILLQSREANPEEILRSLGFGSSQNDEVKARIPQRFFSDSKFCIDDFKQRSELQELFDSWKSEKNSSDQLMQHPLLGPCLHRLGLLSSVQSQPSKLPRRSSLTSPQSILIPDNQKALAAQGYYEYPSVMGGLTENSKQSILPASERRKNFRSTRTQQTWSLIEPEQEAESELVKLKQNKHNFGASVDSALSSDLENSLERRNWQTYSRWGFRNQPSKDSESNTSSLRDLRLGHVNKLMSFEETDDDCEVFSPSEDHRRIFNNKSNGFQEPEPKICDNFQKTSLELDLNSDKQTESRFDFRHAAIIDSLNNINDLMKYSKSTEPSELEVSPSSAASMDILHNGGLTTLSAEEADFSDYPANTKEVRRLKIGAQKDPSIYRIGSAQSDSSGYVESDSLVEPPMSYLDALSANDVGDRGAYDSSEAIHGGICKRLSINSDTTVKDLAASSSSSSSQCPCDKSVGTEQIFKSDRAVSTDPFPKQTMASQTDTCCFCSWCASPNQVCAHLHSSVPYQTTVPTAYGMSLHIDASNNFSPITDPTSGTSPRSASKKETSVLNLFISDGNILFCDNDSNNNQKWKDDDVDGSTRSGCSYRELESTGTNQPESQLCKGHQNYHYKDTDSPFGLLSSRSVSWREETSKNVIEYRKLLKLTNRKTFIQSFVNNPFLPYTPRVKIEIWAEKPINTHLQEENQLMQHAVQRYKFDLQIIESTFLSCYNHMAELLSDEETLMMDELYELWTAVNIEVGHLEKLLAERQYFVRNGSSQLTTLTSLQVIPLMTDLLKEQLCAFQLNNDIFELTMEPHRSNPVPFYQQPGWQTLSTQMQNLQSQIAGHNNMQSVRFNKSMEELKDSMMVEIQRNITQNFNQLFMVSHTNL
ncbi:uncharacterized protein LOC115215466 isoform X1 [Octopus sinensis]|uniref:Uncharacterized protein LOC115215466 isoform X1 n=1 Tax=Octopus sinensis TaxID=2607531 RepID=A0A7E6F2M4_9MOLL|nr:uncharacterized protein LOC115215466 isoform X1 [Octopus sinensis]